MTEDEWDEITVEVLALWPAKPISDKSFEIWFRDLSEFEGEQVHAAVIALYRDGREWAPNGAQIRNKLIELRSDSGDWSAAYRLACEAAQSHGGAEYGGLSWLRDRDPLVAQVAEHYGWRDFCLSDAPDTTRRAQFRSIFEEVHGSAERHERYRGLPSGGLKVLESANAGPRRLGEMVALEGGEDAA